VQIGGKSVVFSPAYGSPVVMDLDRGRRYGTLEDFQNFIKLAYDCPCLPLAAPQRRHRSCLLFWAAPSPNSSAPVRR
jgi:trimethylamine:corrinoid methyltransferase-like protein